MEVSLTETELAWAAGVFEGEGTVRINALTKRNWGALVVSTVNCDATIPEWFHAQWGGYLKRSTASGNRRDYITWVIACQNADRFLEAIMPYFMCEHQWIRALLGREFQGQKRKLRKGESEAYRAEQIRYYEWMRAMNRRGRGA